MLRVNYQTMVWKQTLERQPKVPNSGAYDRKRSVPVFIMFEWRTEQHQTLFDR